MASGIVDVRVIRPVKRELGVELGELWEYRELLFFLTWRNVLVRYKQAALGVSWALLQPAFLLIVFSVFFGHLAKVPSNGIPYPIFAYAGLLPWMLFANSIAQASNSLVGNAQLLTKVYFPRLLLPLSTLIAAVVDFTVAILLLLGLMVYYGIYPRPIAIVLLPAMAALVVAVSLAVGLWLSALNVRYRDVQYVVPFLVQLWLFATPVVYPASLVHQPWRTVYGLNPMAGAVEGFRYGLVHAGPSPGPMLLVSAAVVLVLLLSGIVYFRRAEQGFADVI